MSDRVYESLLGHMRHHQVKKWLLVGAKHEKAHTIGEAVRRMPEHRLVRKLARILAEENEE